MTFRSGSREPAPEEARRALDRIGATGIKINRPKPSLPNKPHQHSSDKSGLDAESRARDDGEYAEDVANLMAKLEMDVFGHP